MKKFLRLAFCTFALLCICCNSATAQSSRLRYLSYVFPADSLNGFDESATNATALQNGFFGSEYKVFMYRAKRNYINVKYGISNGNNSLSVFAKENTPTSPLAAPCVNEDFEASPSSTSTSAVGSVGSTLTGWTVSQGSNSGSCAMLGCCPTVGSTDAWVRTTPYTAPTPMTLIPNSPLGGTKVLQMNDNKTNMGEVVRIQQTFPVASTNALFQLAYMAAMNGSAHACCDQPYMKITLLNCANAPLACPSVSITPPGSACVSSVPAGWVVNTSGVSYTTAWQIFSLDLTPYIGTCVTVQITVGDCDGWAHAGWAFIDCKCSPMSISVNANTFPAGSSVIFASACGATSSTVTAPAGLGPYVWQGPPGSGINTNTNQVITTSTSGNYTLTMTPPGSCAPITKTVNLTFAPTPTASFTQVNSCTTYTFTNTGSAAPAVQTYSFVGAGAPGSFTTTSTSTVVSFPPSTTFTVYHSVVNTASCTATNSMVITTPVGPNPAFTAVPGFTQCFVGNSFQFNATQAATTHTYAFNPTAGAPPTGNTANYGPVAFTAPGTYTVTHTIVNAGCTSVTSSVVVVNPPPSGVLTSTNPSCGLNNGVIIITNTSPAGQTVTSFSLNGVALATQTVTGLAAGTYSVVFTNNFGCKTTYTVTLVNTPPITAIATTFTNAACGVNNGAIAFGAVTGGTPTYSISVNNGPFAVITSTTNLAPGTYTITVKDSKGCTFTKTVVIASSTGPTALSFTTTPNTCLGGAGSVTVGVTGGTAAYTYSLNGVSSGSTATGLATGTHTMLVKDANGCTITATFNIGVVSGPTAATVLVTNATCGSANGSATVTSVTGGLAPYQYSWNGGPFGATNNIGGMTAGPKTVVIKDANSCTLTVNFVIANPGSPTVTVSGITNVTCFGGANGSFTVSTVGGTPGYGYTITPTNATNSIGIFNGLSSQAYTITVKDAAGCVITTTAVVNQPPALTLTLTATPAKCNGTNTGSITAVGGGGTGTLAYSLNGGPFVPGPFIGLPAGTYTVTVRDANNCTLTQTTIITQPTPLAMTFTTTPNSCVGSAGSVTIGVTGGTTVYTYSIDGSTTGSTATGLASGTHTALVKDANGCTITATFNIGVVVGPTAATIVTGNATCGSANGTATVTSVTGGLALYQYSFNGGAFSLSNTVGSLTAGTHTVVVKDANGCTYTVNFNINNTGSPVSNISASASVTCNGGSNGSFTVNTVGGTPGYNYTLTPGGTTNSTGIFTGLTSQNYNITVKDAVGCVTTVSVNISQPPALTLTLTPTAAKCNGTNTGSITAVGGGGIGTLQYSLNGGPFVPGPFIGLPAGTYTVTVRDANNCTLTQTTIITQPTPLALVLATAPNSCAGSVGSVTLTASGGSPVYNYSVNSISIPTNTNSGLTSGTHTAQVQDANGCLITGTFTIGNIPGPTTATINTTNANCGGSNGSATVTAVGGGTAPYQYSFNGGPFSSTNLVSGLSAGTKTVTVIDFNGCTVTLNFNIGNTGGPVSSIPSVSNVLCFGGSSGSFTVNTGGGTPGYSYTISPTNVTSGTGIFANLTAQNYTVTVKDAAGCITTVTTTVNQPTALTLTLSSLPPSCNAGSNGTVSAVGSNGTGPYQFSLNGGPFQTATSFTGVAAGIYNVTIKDNNGCTLTQSVQVTQPAAITLTFTSTNSNCTAANGTGSVTAVGGTPIYTYTWSGGGGNSSQTNPVVAGNHSVTVKDANGCTATGVVVINATPGGTAVITATTNVTCFGLNNGSLTSGVIGPMVAPLSYSWSNSQITQTANNLAPGSYTVKITDAFGCIATVAGTITQPGILDFGLTTTSVTCFGGNNGTGTVNYLGGGTPPFTYLWTAGGATTSVASNLPAGNYTCTMTDFNGCSTTHTTNVTQASSVTLTASVTTANCNQSNGSATVSASGGTPAYNYTWSTSATGPVLSGVAAGTYSILLKDANNCTYTVAATIPNAAGPTIAIATSSNVSCFGGNNGVATATAAAGVPPYTFLWSNAQNTGSATNLMNGVYTVTVTDQMGCKASTSVTITQPSLLVVNASGTNPLCFGSANGVANAGVLGGTAGYTYTWTPSGGNASSASGLIAGNYLVTVQDANGCTATSTIGLSNPAQMTAAITSTNVSCNGACNGMANATTANSVGFVSYFWTGGPGPLTTQNVANLCNGTYTMLATDLNNCTASAIVTITQPSALTASITASGNPSCATYTNGFATVTAGGGTPAYTYSWSGSPSTLATAPNLGAGVYSVTVSDSKGCNVTTQVTITQPAALQSTLTTVNVTCNGLNNGIGNVAYTGGTGPYTFLWLPTLNNSSSVANLPPGTHTIQITDNLGCVTTKTATITQPAPLVATITSTNSNCTQANGNACVSVTGGTGTLSYLWSSNPTFTNSCIPNVVAGAYTITVTDANNCTVSGIAIINDIAGPSVVITATTAVSCFGGSNGSAITSITGGVAPVTQLWSYLAQTTPNVSNLPAGLHSITVKDAANCVASASVMITQPTQLVSAIANVVQITCNGASNGTATMLLNGGTPAYSYTWSNGGPVQSSSVAVSMGPGTWTCNVTDNNGCPTSQQVTISQPNPLVINSFTVTNILCNGSTTGQIATNITGGTPVYTIQWTPTQPANAVITNLAAGSYSILVTDTKSCTTSGTYNIIQPSAILTSATATAATCGNANGSATVTANGGTPGYTYNWNTPTPQITPTATGMAAATWMCTITDLNGCIATQTVSVPNAPGPQITAMSFTAPLCFGQQNGSMAMTFTSGTSPYTYLWNNPGASTSQNVSGVGAGVYSATVTDVYGCTSSSVISVTQPNQLILNVSPNITICYGQLTQIYGAAGGGTQPYNYTWNPSTLTGAGPHVVTPTVTTTYTVAVVDNNGCPTIPIVITVNVRPDLQATGYSLTRCDGKPAVLTPNISSTSFGNGGPYTYNWSNGATAPSITVPANYLNNPNIYTVTIDDGCTIPSAQATFTINVNPRPSGTFSSDVQKGCQPLQVNFTATSTGTNTTTFNWIFGNETQGTGSPTSTIYNNVGLYNVYFQMINQFGCKRDTTIYNYIEVYPAPTAEFYATPWAGSIIEPTINFVNESQNANTYFWDFGDYNSSSNNSTVVNPHHDYTYAGIYSVYLVAISDKGCTDTVMHTVEITPDYAIYIPNAFTPDANNVNDTFFPKGVGLDENSYRMYIFDRWGEQIFTSDNIYKGWDGTVKGSKGIAEEGVYIYKIWVKDLGGNQHYYVGHVTCLPRESKIK